MYQTWYKHFKLIYSDPQLNQVYSYRNIVATDYPVSCHKGFCFKWFNKLINYRLNQGNLAVSYEPGRSLRRQHLIDIYFQDLQDMSNPRNPQASRMVPLMLILKKYAVVLYYNTQASIPTINLV